TDNDEYDENRTRPFHTMSPPSRTRIQCGPQGDPRPVAGRVRRPYIVAPTPPRVPQGRRNFRRRRSDPFLQAPASSCRNVHWPHDVIAMTANPMLIRSTDLALQVR